MYLFIYFFYFSGSSISSTGSPSEPGSENSSLSDQSDTDSLMSCDQNKMSLQFLTDSQDISTMEELYQPLVGCIDPDLHVLKITDKSEGIDNSFTSLPDLSATLPSMAIMMFLQEEGPLGFKRIQTVQRCFEKFPWKFHHSEHVARGAINPYPYNSRDFYYTSEDMPLWAVRQVHTGKEFFRTMLFVGERNWTKMMQFYKLVIGREPDMKREDFCLFTINAFQNFDVQLALKKLKGDTKPRVLGSVRLQFKVSDLSNIVSLLPNVCRPLSDARWETTDVDGNFVVLEIPQVVSSHYSNSSFSERSSLSGRSSLSEGNFATERVNFVQNRGRGESNNSRQFNTRNRNSVIHVVTGSFEQQRDQVDSDYVRSLDSKNRISLNQSKRSGSIDEKIQPIVTDNGLHRLKTKNSEFKRTLANEFKTRFAAFQRNQRKQTGSDNDFIERADNTRGRSASLKSFYV